MSACGSTAVRRNRVVRGRTSSGKIDLNDFTSVIARRRNTGIFRGRLLDRTRGTDENSVLDSILLRAVTPVPKCVLPTLDSDAPDCRYLTIESELVW
jgi:hypothetical protein